MSDPNGGPDTRLDNNGRFFPSLRASEWITFGALAGALAAATEEAGNDTMLAGASIFAAGAVVSILWVVLSEVFKFFDAEWFTIG